MALTVATNTGALMAQAAASSVNKEMETSMERLSTGKRINAASDDAAGVAIASRLTAEIKGTNMALRNAMDGQALIDTAEGAHVEIENILQRMRELALESANGTTDVKDRTYLNKEYRALADEINRIATTTEWNGRTILDNTADGSASGLVKFQIGVDVGTTLSVDFGNFTQVAGSGTFHEFTSASGTAASLSATTTANAQSNAGVVVTQIDSAIDAVNLKRAEFGAATNRLTHTVDNLTNIATNAESTRSSITDTDYAAATSELARTQIIAQAGTAMLAQANQMPQTVLALLQ